MKPCSHNRKHIAALALGHLETESATALRTHLESCAGCRQYFGELTKLSATIKATEPAADIPATAAFHQRVVAKVQRQRLKALPTYALANLLNWRIALPAAVGIVLAALLISRLQPPAPSIPVVVSQTSVRPTPDADLPPTLANYDMIANESLDRLDQMLTEQGKKNLPSAPLYTASTIAVASKTD